jgi:hypothetical protein
MSPKGRPAFGWKIKMEMNELTTTNLVPRNPCLVPRTELCPRADANGWGPKTEDWVLIHLIILKKSAFLLLATSTK